MGNSPSHEAVVEEKPGPTQIPSLGSGEDIIIDCSGAAVWMDVTGSGQSKAERGGTEFRHLLFRPS